MSRSASLAEFTKALSRVQAALEGATKEATNPHFNRKYADLSSIWNACQGPLTQNGFAVVSSIEPVAPGGQGIGTLTTTLLHESGEWVDSSTPLLVEGGGRSAMQSLGSAITYARRYALAALVGVCPEDDDGEGTATQAPAAAQRRREPRPERAPAAPEPAAAPARESFDQMLRRTVAESRGAIENEFQLIVALAKRAVEAGLVAQAAIGQPGKATVLDQKRARAAVAELYGKRPGQVAKSAAKYAEQKQAEAAGEVRGSLYTEDDEPRPIDADELEASEAGSRG